MTNVNTNCLVIYYDGNFFKAKVMQSEFPNSSAPYVFGLEPDDQVIAVVAGYKKETSLVFIDEEEVDLL